MQETSTLTTEDGKIVMLRFDDPLLCPVFTATTMFSGYEHGFIQAHKARSGKTYFYLRKSLHRDKEEKIRLIDKSEVELIIMKALDSKDRSIRFAHSEATGEKKFEFYIPILKEHGIEFEETA